MLQFRLHVKEEEVEEKSNRSIVSPLPLTKQFEKCELSERAHLGGRALPANQLETFAYGLAFQRWCHLKLGFSSTCGACCRCCCCFCGHPAPSVRSVLYGYFLKTAINQLKPLGCLQPGGYLLSGRSVFTPLRRYRRIQLSNNIIHRSIIHYLPCDIQKCDSQVNLEYESTTPWTVSSTRCVGILRNGVRPFLLAAAKELQDVSMSFSSYISNACFRARAHCENLSSNFPDKVRNLGNCNAFGCCFAIRLGPRVGDPPRDCICMRNVARDAGARN
uniref:Uncharacterized protein n=1 Tax=Trichuris muris TaxID=70415 RepID=A0A5S6Q747_TRIMR